MDNPQNLTLYVLKDKINNETIKTSLKDIKDYLIYNLHIPRPNAVLMINRARKHGIFESKEIDIYYEE